MFSGLFGGQGLFDPGDVYEDERVLILHGRHGLLTWTAVVAKDTGQMSMSIANLGRARSVRKLHPATIAIITSGERGPDPPGF